MEMKKIGLERTAVGSEKQALVFVRLATASH